MSFHHCGIPREGLAGRWPEMLLWMIDEDPKEEDEIPLVLVHAI
jgi:hypothetical protein